MITHILSSISQELLLLQRNIGKDRLLIISEKSTTSQNIVPNKVKIMKCKELRRFVCVLFYFNIQTHTY